MTTIVVLVAWWAMSMSATVVLGGARTRNIVQRDRMQRFHKALLDSAELRQCLGAHAGVDVVGDPLAKGGFGVVVKAHREGTPIALKIMPLPSWFFFGTDTAMFNTEVRVLNEMASDPYSVHLSSPHHLIGPRTCKGTPFTVGVMPLEFAPGGNLGAWLDSSPVIRGRLVASSSSSLSSSSPT